MAWWAGSNSGCSSRQAAVVAAVSTVAKAPVVAATGSSISTSSRGRGHHGCSGGSSVSKSSRGGSYSKDTVVVTPAKGEQDEQHVSCPLRS